MSRSGKSLSGSYLNFNRNDNYPNNSSTFHGNTGGFYPYPTDDGEYHPYVDCPINWIKKDSKASGPEKHYNPKLFDTKSKFYDAKKNTKSFSSLFKKK